MLLFVSLGANATQHTIFVFCTGINPVSTTASCGDSIAWTWGGCTDSTRSTVIPACATPWAHVINSTTPYYTVVNCAGTYNFTCYCNTSYHTGTITVTCSSSLGVTITNSTNCSCNGSCDGTATASASGGTPPYIYSWNTVPVQTSATATGLCAGTYTVTVHDATSAIATATVLITQPQPITLSMTNTNELCNGDCNATASVTVTGGTPGYTYAWTCTSQTTASVNGLCAGNCTCTVTDSHGCLGSNFCMITQPPLLTVSVTTTSASCSSCCDGSASASVSGGVAPYSYSWSPTGGPFNTANNLCPGSYTCCVTDADGCMSCSSGTVNFVTGIQSQNSLPTFSVYPSPASQTITIEGNLTSSMNAEISICDMLGKMQFRKMTGNVSTIKETINVADLPPGIYFVTIKTQDGNSVRRFVKQ